MTKSIRPTLALAIATALIAGCQAPTTQAPSAPATEAGTTPVTGAALTPVPATTAAPVATAGFSIPGRATLFGKPLANATVRIFALGEDTALAEGRSDANGHFAISLAQAPTTPLLRVVAITDAATLATLITTSGVTGPSARRVLVSVESLLSEVSTTAYAALYPRLRALRDLTSEEAAQVTTAFSSLTSVLASATEAQRQTAINAVVLAALDANGWLKDQASVDRAGYGVVQGIPGFREALETAGTTLGTVIGSASLPSVTFGKHRSSGGGVDTPTQATADLMLTIDLPGTPAALRLLALPSGVSNVRVTLSGPTTVELAREPGATEDPMTFHFNGLPVGAGYSVTCRAEGLGGMVLGTTTRVLTLDGDGHVQLNAAGQVIDQASFTLQAGTNALSVRLPLGGPTVQVAL